ncbi:MAG: cell division protein FtsZ [Oscillospiraceae bacterium]|jgi:cell division protein FtsZ|nr:cell division protein FtsZ [Oscillospiraceae bacterium]
MAPYEIETGPDNVVVIKVVGVGGAGNNAVDDMLNRGVIKGVEFIAVNTDKPVLSKSKATTKIQIGEKVTKGQGAGANPEIGRRAAEESRNEIAKVLEETDMVFIAAGMGGGTGTGAAPLIADIAREVGALTVGIVTKPFVFEGAKRMRHAEEGINNMLGKVDSLLVIPNDRLRHVSEQKITFQNAFEIADSVLNQAVESILEIVMNTGLINVDFADVTTVMANSGYAHIGLGEATGKTKAEEAVRKAVASPLMETSINGAGGILINFTGSLDLSLDDVYEAAEIVHEAVSPEADIIIGASIDDSMDDKVRVAIIATKFPEPPQFGAGSAPAVRQAEPKRASSHTERSGAFSAPQSSVTPAAPRREQPEPRAPEPPVEQEKDPFEEIIKIFESR